MEEGSEFHKDWELGVIRGLEKEAMMDGLIHFFKHLIGLCGEPHPSLIMGGGVLLTTISVYFRQISEYIKGLF
tara:strand:- start:408 stop:626 length:219 start_codon:yes stop_codon:yes gene_type:complete